MDPVTIGIMAAGTILKTYGQIKANKAQAAAEERNAAFYREQAAFSAEAGRRSQELYAREGKILEGSQLAAFAKGGSLQGTANFMALEALYRQQESFAIKQESDMNVRLAMMRADQSQRTAEGLKDPLTNIMGAAGNLTSVAGSIL